MPTASLAASLLAIPVLDVLFVSPCRSEEEHVVRTAEPQGREHAGSFSPRFGDTVVAVDHIETAGGDFGQQNRAR
jgi:hypothetical protein